MHIIDNWLIVSWLWVIVPISTRILLSEFSSANEAILNYMWIYVTCVCYELRYMQKRTKRTKFAYSLGCNMPFVTISYIIQANMTHCKTSDISCTLVTIKLLLTHMLLEQCLLANYIFIFILTPGFNGLGKDKWKTSQGTLKFWDWV